MGVLLLFLFFKKNLPSCPYFFCLCINFSKKQDFCFCKMKNFKYNWPNILHFKFFIHMKQLCDLTQHNQESEFLLCALRQLLSLGSGFKLKIFLFKCCFFSFKVSIDYFIWSLLILFEVTW